jgi:ABC-2 type transport system permease protein
VVMKRKRTSPLLAAILINSVYEMRNYPIVLVNTVLSPLSFLLLITFVSRGTLLGVGIEGGLVMSMFSSGMGLQADLSHLKNDFKLQDMVVSSPTPSIVYLVGMATSELIYSLPALVILVILAAIVVHPGAIEAMELLAVFLAMFSTSIAIGFMLSTISRDIVQSFAFSRLLSTLFTTIPPVYYPITYIPLPFRYIAYLSPTTYAAEIAQNAAGYLQLSQVTLVADWTVLLATTGLILFIASKKTRWRES